MLEMENRDACTSVESGVEVALKWCCIGVAMALQWRCSGVAVYELNEREKECV